MKLLIAVPCAWETMHLDTVIWLVQLTSKTPSFGCTDLLFSSYTTPRIMLAHNQAWQHAREKSVDLLMFLDPDMVPAIDVPGERRPFMESSLAHIQQSPRSIVAAPAVRSGDGQINVFLRDEAGGLRPLSADEVQERMTHPRFENVAAIGTGLMLIPRAVLSTLGTCPFQDVYDHASGELLRSQDVEFCLRAAAAGIDVVANWFAPAGHRKWMTLVPIHG